jgi:cullin-associated NEDD8-dissociated protein 1
MFLNSWLIIIYYSLAPLVTKIPSTILAPLIEKLSSLKTDNSVDNSIPAMALRTVVITLPRPVIGVTPTKEVTEAYSAVSRVLIPRLIGHLVLPPPAHMKLPPPPPGMLQMNSDKEVDAEAVDVLIEVVRCFGPMLQGPEIESLQEVVLGILENERASNVVKKRAVVAVSILAIYLSDPVLSSFVSHLIERFRNVHLTLVQRRLYITILGSMARSIPLRFGPYLKTLAPFVLSALSQQELDEQFQNAAEDGEPDPETDDVREAALVALEGFLASCGGEMRPYTEESIAAALRFLKYDPNYVLDEDDEEMGDTESGDDEGFDDDDEFEAEAGFDDDDDDASWKVRRCAAKVLYTLISTRGSGDLLDDGTLYGKVAPVLVNRFSEREQNVRLEIIATMGSLIRKTGEGAIISFSNDENIDYMTMPQGRKRRRESSTITFDTKQFISMSAGLTSPTLEPVPASGPRADLARLTPAIVKAIIKLLKGSAIPSKQAAVTLLENMVAVQHGGLSEYLDQLIDPIVESIKGTGVSSASSTAITTGGAASATAGTLRIAALRLISDISETHSSSVLQPYLAKIVPGVVSAAKDKFYKISGEAVSTVEQLVKALTPPRSRSMGQEQQADLQKLYQVVVGRVGASDADLEVRQRAIHALGILLARTASREGSKLLSASDRAAALEILKDRLKNETTRLSAVRAVDTVAALTTFKDQLHPAWIREVSLELAAQLRKADRSLRGASLGALKNLVVAPAARNSLNTSTVNGLISALLPLLTTADLHLLGPTLLVLSALVEDEPKIVVTKQLNSALCELLTAPLGGAVLDALLILVQKIGEKGVGAPLMNGLLKDVSVNGDPAVVGKVIGTLQVSGGDSVGVTLDSFLKELNTSKEEASKSLALAVLGEAALRMESKSPLTPDIFTAHFNSESSKLPLAAAMALGRAGAGNVSTYLPVILSTMDQGGNVQYLLLHSIKEILQQAGNNPADFTPFTKSIWDKLMVASQIEDNKAVGAECIGRLAIIEPKTYMPQLQVGYNSPAPEVSTNKSCRCF